MMLLIRFTFERFDCTVAPKRYCRQEMFHHAIPIVVGTTDSRETCNIAPGVRPASARRPPGVSGGFYVVSGHLWWIWCLAYTSPSLVKLTF